MFFGGACQGCKHKKMPECQTQTADYNFDN